MEEPLTGPSFVGDYLCLRLVNRTVLCQCSTNEQSIFDSTLRKWATYGASVNTNLFHPSSRANVIDSPLQCDNNHLKVSDDNVFQ